MHTIPAALQETILSITCTKETPSQPGTMTMTQQPIETELNSTVWRCGLVPALLHVHVCIFAPYTLTLSTGH